jgi:acetoin utilization deacetylase AcuC-like enzyme
VPIAKQYGPDLVLVSSGLDPSRMDPFGRMVVTTEGFRAMTRMLLEVAEECSGGRMTMLHEGGYAPTYAPYCGLAIIEELCGERTAIVEPLAKYSARLRPTWDLDPTTARAIDEIVEFQQRYWRLT